eukprot:s2705_g9.t1
MKDSGNCTSSSPQPVLFFIVSSRAWKIYAAAGQCNAKDIAQSRCPQKHQNLQMETAQLRPCGAWPR